MDTRRNIRRGNQNQQQEPTITRTTLIEPLSLSSTPMRSPGGDHLVETGLCFFMLFLASKTVKSSSDGRAHHRNRSGVVDLVGREPLIFVRVENGVTKFSPKRQKTPKFSKKKWIRKKVFSG